MATLLLSVAGSAVGGALFGPLGALAGRALGALGGAVLDRALFTPSRRVEGPRLSDLEVMASTEGAPIPRVYGRARLSGQVIWATDFEEVVATQEQSAGGKGGSLGGGATTTTYSYFANFAVGICEGPVTRIGRIWADGQLLDTQGLDIRLHTGGEEQVPDPLIVARQGMAGAPAYRGLAYLVFERLPLADYGNRLPQIMVEVERVVGALEGRITAVTLIPGATEFGYDTREVKRRIGAGSYAPENRHVTTADTDFEAALDQLTACCPALERVALVVAWFGTDLRAGECTIRPGVENREKVTVGEAGVLAWRVAGQDRAGAHLVSRYEGRPAFGGTPSDASVRRAIAALKARGLKVTLYPFVMMDVPPGNTRPDPWSDAAAQPAYPWRGRITCHPAPGRPGSPDGTDAAGDQVAALFGSASAGDFGTAGGEVTYAGPAEWSLSRMALHYATLASIAGGVEAILIGSEMDALTRVQSAPGVYPAGATLATLASQVKAIVGPETAVSYAANWTEYGAHVVSHEGTGEDVGFPLDALWASPDVDFVGIDWYPPVADWRDGDAHLDAALAPDIYQRAYLAGNVRGGEAFDWYYADDAGRAAQLRLPIADSAHGEDWLFRQKDIAGWWGNAHHPRLGGVRQVMPTAWVPGAKPVRLIEIGCAAVDKGANRPSSFPDPKSAEDGYPPFSSRRRDELMQRRHLEATLDAFAGEEANPPADLPAGRMLEPGALHVWTWDARPWPVFPIASQVWADGANWETGHWLNGRLGNAPIGEMAHAMAADFGLDGLDGTGVRGVIDGYVIDRPMSLRAALEPLASVFALDLAERDGGLALVARGGRPVAVLTDDDLLAGGDDPPLRLVRGAEGELPRQVSIGYLDARTDYRHASAASRRLAGAARAETGADLAMVTVDTVAEAAAEVWLQDAWAGRETANFALAPSRLALEPGDIVRLDRDGRERLFAITTIEDGEGRRITARSIDPEVFALPPRDPRTGSVGMPPAYGPAEALVVMLPALDAAQPTVLAHLAVFAAPWPGAMAVWRSIDGASFRRIGTLPAPAVIGATATALPPGPAWRWDRAAVVEVELDGGLLTTASEAAVLEGANALALIAPDGAVEVIQFAEAELVGTRRWRLRGLLRGQLGTEAGADSEWPAGTRIVRVDRNLLPVAEGFDLLGRAATFRIGRARRNHGEPDVTELSATIGPRTLAPLAPVHARGRRVAGGIALSWIRRSRVDGDGWGLVEIPLGEEREAYRLDILDGSTTVRSFEVTTASLLYAGAEESADFGGPQSILDIRIAQLSASVGAGAALTVRLRL
ncbi:baseplate multidomain protein megatron [Ancylobacter terrae]|uniref:baseplate multidomain protein megatron n=1 Tax=Ancylobacter sp. sgz301288 TaxID=3342077 RepID=UPI0038586E30